LQNTSADEKTQGAKEIMKIQWRKRMKSIFLVFLFSVLFFPVTVLGAEKGYFENPNEIYERFRDRIYNDEFEVQYAFLKEGASIYGDQNGSSKIGKAAKYTGVIVVSQTKSYVQVIYETKSGYGIGWMKRSRYEKIGLLYNGAEKQLLADGTYEMKSVSSGKSYTVELKFQENQQYQIINQEDGTCLDLVMENGVYQAEPCWAEESDSESQHWQLIREYDGFYLKNKLASQYLVSSEGKELALTKYKGEIQNCFKATETSQGTEKMQWQFTRTSGKNVNPYRNFLQYDPDWGKEDYGDVDDYSGKIAAAGCGVVAITNAVYALNGQFVDPMLLADYAVDAQYRIIGSGTDDGIFKAAAKEFGDAYQFHYVGKTYDVFTMRDYLKEGCVAISHVPGHYVTVAEYSEKKDKYLVLDSHPIASRPTDPFGNWFPWNRLESGGLASSCYYIYSTDKDLKISTTKATTASN
jgi:hypothetical protein